MDNLIKNRITAFRNIMIRENLSALYISGTDPHRSEYLCEHWQTRRFTTGFSGSFGEVIITLDHAGLWTDTRYFLQAEDQLKNSGIELHKLRVPQAVPVVEWLLQNLGKGDRVGIDPVSLPLETYRQFSERLKEKNISLIFTGHIMDEIWEDRPSLPCEPVFELTESLTGASRREKLNRIRELLNQNGCDLTIITALDDLAWTYNLRGSDIAYNPVFYGFAIIGQHINQLFLRQNVLSPDLSKKLTEKGITLSDYSDFYTSLATLSGNTVFLDPACLNTGAWSAIHSNCCMKEGISIPGILKSIKNKTELKGFREAMRKDGIALVEFLWWLKNNIGNTFISEYSIGRKLAEFRAKQEGFMGESFAPIVGYAGHGAVVHLTVDETNALPVMPEGILLIDSGGHYLTGTTDTTRTVALGAVTDQQKRDFTLVLKGMIALSMAVFPVGTKGVHLDILARQALWQNGLNYGHGTGHGVGHFLSVHEGGASIRQEYNPREIEAGMVFSNEPGIYRTDEYGVRTENMIVCVEKQTTVFGKFLGFETLTCCPIDISLIEVELLNSEERKWLNDYHLNVKRELFPLLTDVPQEFLEYLTREI
jgi:Xaa-Pro aminopeptidase